MPVDLELLNPNYKPALLALSAADVVTACKDILRELHYKVLVATNETDFATRYNTVQFQLVLIEEQFAAPSLAENASLRMLQHLPMPQRRHSIIFLLGHNFETLNPFQAFAQSVHAVVNWADLGSLSQVIPQVVSEQNLFLNVFREAQLRTGTSRN